MVIKKIPRRLLFIGSGLVGHCSSASASLGNGSGTSTVAARPRLVSVWTRLGDGSGVCSDAGTVAVRTRLGSGRHTGWPRIAEVSEEASEESGRDQGCPRSSRWCSVFLGHAFRRAPGVLGMCPRSLGRDQGCPRCCRVCSGILGQAFRRAPCVLESGYCSGYGSGLRGFPGLGSRFGLCSWASDFLLFLLFLFKIN